MKFSVAIFLVLMYEVDHITSSKQVPYDDRNPGFLFDNHPGQLLSLPANMTNIKQRSTKVSDKIDCVFACTGTPWCRSVNFKIRSEKDGRHLCELIAKDSYTHRKYLKQDEKFTHLSIKNPCKDKPCLNKAKCIAHQNRLDYRCKCGKGFTGEKCQHDINECTSGSHGCHSDAVCINSPGSFTCQCKTGFTGNGKDCRDIDECSSGSHGCHSNALCINSPGSFTCQCRTGFTGNGKDCTDIDECSSGSHGCYSKAVCINSPGSFTCQCRTGFTGNGKVCTDIDECSSGSHGCHSNSVCINSPGSFFCQCKNNFARNGNGCRVSRDCSEYYKSGDRRNGVYTIKPDSQSAFQVYCDMTTDHGGWTVFQRRQDGSVDFYRNWQPYKTGFGNLNGEFWLGNDYIHRLAARTASTLRVDMEDWGRIWKYAKYGNFSVNTESDKYRLSVGSYSGNAGDSMIYHNNMQFSTKDQDNDVDSGNCAVRWTGACWYKSCHQSNLNGRYLGRNVIDQKGVNWYHFYNNGMSLKFTEMKMRPQTFMLH